MLRRVCSVSPDDLGQTARQTQLLCPFKPVSVWLFLQVRNFFRIVILSPSCCGISLPSVETEDSWHAARRGTLQGLRGCCQIDLGCLWPWLAVHPHVCSSATASIPGSNGLGCSFIPSCGPFMSLLLPEADWHRLGSCRANIQDLSADF